jgi:hypothetical protein
MPAPRSLPLPALTLAICGLALAAGSAPCLAQANFVETFDDIVTPSYSVPQALLQRGWDFRNQSQPAGSRSYFPGVLPSTNSIYFGPQSGAGYLGVDSGCTDYYGQMSAWAILPPIAGQVAGDTVTLWLRAMSGTSGVEVRYSPSGGTGTGSGASQVGDFTQVLTTINPVSTAGWSRHQATVPGNGRIALRYVGTRAGIGSFEPYVGLDTLSVGAPPPAPCNQPPIPQPGQTATWTAASSPYTVCQDISIPAGATVNIQPGVTINFENDRQLVVAGTLNINGTSASRVVLGAPDNFPPFVKVQGGTLNANFADFRQQLRVAAGGNVLLHDSGFTSDGTNLQGGMLTSDSLFGPAVPYVLLERCTFTQTICILSDCLTVLRNNTFNDTSTWLLRGFADISAPNTFVGQPLEITREEPIQAGFVDGVNASGVANSAGLSLDGGSWLLGPGNQLSGNLYPIRVIGGVMPGSTITSTGNVNDAIDIAHAGFRGDGRWPRMAIPYRITEAGADGGDIYISPGVVIEADPGAGLLASSYRRILARGTPQAPITFRPASPGGSWAGLFFDTNFDAYPHVENCIFQGATRAIGGIDTVTIRVDNCRFINNALAALPGFNTRVLFGKTLFTGNAVGCQRDSYLLNLTNPNAFEGNTIAVEGSATSITHAEAVWWNSPTGPSNHPQNPGGAGDPIGANAGSVSIFPFLTERPNFSDQPPIVRAKDPGLRSYATLKAGSRFILEWDASDDGTIATQSVYLLGGETPSTPIAENLPGTQRRLEFMIPSVGFEVLNTPQRVRIEVTDNAGQVGIDQFPVLVPSDRITGELAFSSQTTSTFVGQTFIAGADIPGVTFTGAVTQYPAIDLYLVIDGDAWYIPGYANSQYQYGSFGRGFPHVSTDLARLALRARNNSNDQKWFYSGYFSIRHDPRLGFSPPQVQLQSPASGAQFPGGGVVPISWTASASQGLYAFDIQASYDGGREWNVIARELPATATSYNWQLPASAGIPDVRVRVIARDRRFQNSSSDMSRIFSITPGTGPAPCYANCDSSTVAPILNVGDFTCFLQRFAAGESYANCDQSTVPPILNVGDFTCFLQRFAAGCP